MFYKILIFLSFSLTLFSQNHVEYRKIDSLIDAIKYNNSISYSLKIEYLNDISEKSRDLEYQLGEGLSYLRIATIYSHLNKPKKALEYAIKGKTIAHKIKNDSLIFFYEFSRALNYGRTGFTDKANNIFKDCLKKIDVIKDPDSKSYYYGRIYTQMANLNFENNTNENEYKRKIKLHKIALSYFEKCKKKKGNESYASLGYFYKSLNKLDSSEYFLKKGLKVNRNSFHLNGIQNYYINLAKVYFKKQNYSLATKFIDSSLNASVKENDIYVLKESYGLLSEIFELKNDSFYALKYKKLEQIYNDSLSRIDHSYIKESANYLYKNVEDDNENLNKRIYHLFYLIIFLLLLILIIAFAGKVFEWNLRRKMNVLSFEKLEHESIVEVKDFESISTEELIIKSKKVDPLFVVYFKNKYPVFYKRLITILPDLTINELRYCFYLKLRFSSKEISDIMCVSPKAIYNRNNRFRKRLNLKEAEDLYAWAENLDKD